MNPRRLERDHQVLHIEFADVLRQVELARSQAFRDAQHALLRNAEIWEEDGSDPCRVRVTRDLAESLGAWADGRGTPDDPASCCWPTPSERASGWS